MRETRSTCPYCGVGCGVIIESDGRRVTGVRGDPQHPANFGQLCSKGNTLHLSASDAVIAQARLLQPMQRAQRGQALQSVSWDVALDAASRGLARIVDAHGPDALGVYISGQLLTEDYYVFNKLAKGLIGTNNIDSNSRLCMSSAVAGYKLTLGADAPPTCYEDIDHARCLFIIGSNPAFAHPILFRRIEAAKQRNPALRVIVVDPRRTDSAELADLHLALQPGSDIALLHGMLHLMLREGWTDPAYIAAHTKGFDALKTLVRDYTPQRVAQTCGIAESDLITAARWFAGVDGAQPRTPTLSLYCQGLNQSSSGSAKNASLINLHLATGQIAKSGAGPFSLTGQPNAMGGREVGGMANLLSAHRDLANPAHRQEVATLWGLPDVPSAPGKTAVEMFEAAAQGQIKALWLVCTNPAQSMPDQTTVRRALQRAELVIVQEAFASAATCGYADLVLPAASWAEKDGCVTNSERRISRVRAAVAAPGQARADWRIAVDVARRLQAHWRPTQPDLFGYDSAESIWLEHRASTRGRDLDISGLSYATLERDGPQQWPFRPGQTCGTPRLYTDGRFATDDGRARFAALPFVPLAQACDARYPFALTTGRLRDQWHGMTRTATIARLFGHVAEPSVQLNPQDMARLGLADGDLVYLTSRRGAIVIPAQGSTTLQPLNAFIAMHWGSEYLSGRNSQGQPLAGVNALTSSAHCPLSKQPELKHSAVKVLKADLPWRLLAVAWLSDDQALATVGQLRALMGAFEFASCTPFGRERTGVLFRAAAHDAADPAVLAQIESLLGLSGADALRYHDKRRQQQRSARLQRNASGSTLQAFMLAGDTSAEDWIKVLLQSQLDAAKYGRLLLMPTAKAPHALTAASPQVCACCNVGEDAIVTALARSCGDEAQRLSQLQTQLQCGTRCGSCMPQLRRLIRANPVALTSA